VVHKIRDRASAAAQRGMTLIEIMVVVLIMGLIMGTVGFAVFRYFRRSQVKTTQLKVKRVLDAVQEWQADPDVQKKGDADCPGSLSELVPERLKRDMIKDAWNNKLRLTCQGTKICVYSNGQNKRDENGGGDDIKACTEEDGE
jgi:prepilin-type N-terminal cleavage/methylation domain-containing protein